MSSIELSCLRPEILSCREMSLSLSVIPERETAIAADVMPSQLVYEEIRDVPAPLDPYHPYEDVEAAGLQAAAETGADSYHFTLCSAYYGVSDSQL